MRKNVIDSALFALANGAKRLFANPLALLDVGDDDIAKILERNFARGASPMGGALRITKLVNDEGRITMLPDTIAATPPPPPKIHTLAEQVSEAAAQKEQTTQLAEDVTPPPPPSRLPFKSYKYIGFHLEDATGECGYAMAPLDSWQNVQSWRYVPALVKPDLYNPVTGKTKKILPRYYVGIDGYVAGSCTPIIYATGIMDTISSKTLDFYFVVPAGTSAGISFKYYDGSTLTTEYTSPPGWGTYGPSAMWQEEMFHFAEFVDDPATGFIMPSVPITPFQFTITERLTKTLTTIELSNPIAVTVARTFPTCTATVEWSVDAWEHITNGDKLFREGFYSTMRGFSTFDKPYPMYASQSFVDKANIARHGYLYIERTRNFLTSAFDQVLRERWSPLYYFWQVQDGGTEQNKSRTITLFAGPTPAGDFGSNQGFKSFGIVKPVAWPQATGANIIGTIPEPATPDGFHQTQFMPVLWPAFQVYEEGTLRAIVAFHGQEFEIDARDYSGVPVGVPRKNAELEEGGPEDTLDWWEEPSRCLVPGGSVYLDIPWDGETYTFFCYSALSFVGYRFHTTFNYETFGGDPNFTTLWDSLGTALNKATFGIVQRSPDGTIVNNMITLGGGGNVLDFQGKKFTGFFTVFHGQERN